MRATQNGVRSRSQSRRPSEERPHLAPRAAGLGDRQQRVDVQQARAPRRTSPRPPARAAAVARSSRTCGSSRSRVPHSSSVGGRPDRSPSSGLASAGRRVAGAPPAAVEPQLAQRQPRVGLPRPPRSPGSRRSGRPTARTATRWVGWGPGRRRPAAAPAPPRGRRRPSRPSARRPAATRRPACSNEVDEPAGARPARCASGSAGTSGSTTRTPRPRASRAAYCQWCRSSPLTNPPPCR